MLRRQLVHYINDRTVGNVIQHVI
ncbi:hypothetical protein BGLA2_860021 [Burkholderia gladioli]|nr:hypothetical protein BGLA2_860021 [Burkholderia gladioli]